MTHRIICCWTCKYSQCLSEGKLECRFRATPVSANYKCGAWEDGGVE